MRSVNIILGTACTVMVGVGIATSTNVILRGWFQLAALVVLSLGLLAAVVDVIKQK